MAKKIVVKVSFSGNCCKTGVLKAVTKVQGIDQRAVDSEKETLVIVGDVDHVRVIAHLRRKGYFVQIDSVGRQSLWNIEKQRS